MIEALPDTTHYRLGRRSHLWATLIPLEHNGSRTWELQVVHKRPRARSGAVLLETTASHPFATVKVKGETYALAITRHSLARGGVLVLGGERLLGGGHLKWDLRLTPRRDAANTLVADLRINAGLRSTGDVRLEFSCPLYQAGLWTMAPASRNGDFGALAWTPCQGNYAGLCVSAPDSALWDEDASSFQVNYHRIALGGGKRLIFTLVAGQGKTSESARPGLVNAYAEMTAGKLHPLREAPILSCAAEHAICVHTDPDRYVAKGAQRLYVRGLGFEDDENFVAGHPFYPLDALCALADRHRFRESDEILRLVRFAGHGIATDFQVMASGSESEPNKGAFWDRLRGKEFRDWSGGLTHGIGATARIAAALFRLHGAVNEPLFLQSAINACQWLLLKQNERGYYDGERVQATREQRDDGDVVEQACSLQGAEVIRPFILAYHATRRQIWIDAASRIARYLMDERLNTFDSVCPARVAVTIQALVALDREAPHARLRTFIHSLGNWLRALPLSPASVSMNADGMSCGLFECARAGLDLYVLEADPIHLRYAFAALDAVPQEARRASWRSIDAFHRSLLACALGIPNAKVSFDDLTVTFNWRKYEPDPATGRVLQVEPIEKCGNIDFLPLVCHGNDQLLIIVRGDAGVSGVTIKKTGRTPIVRDIITGEMDSAALLHHLPNREWTRIGLFLIDP